MTISHPWPRELQGWYNTSKKRVLVFENNACKEVYLLLLSFRIKNLEDVMFWDTLMNI